MGMPRSVCRFGGVVFLLAQVLACPSARTAGLNDAELAVRLRDNRPSRESDRQQGWKPAVATVFWVGEQASLDNAYVHNRASAWDADWLGHYGGVDVPMRRCGYRPCGFTPRENPFYVALPYDDMTEGGQRKSSASAKLGGRSGRSVRSSLKNRWIQVRSAKAVCYGQWEDVGPFETDDFDYVFGASVKPRNARDVGAGLDLSAALRDCLHVGNVSRVEWRHVDQRDVPPGPWTEIVTKRLGP
jgi:hypothetical protein